MNLFIFLFSTTIVMRYNLAITNFDITECARSVIIICTNTHLNCFLILFVEIKNIIVNVKRGMHKIKIDLFKVNF